jgi:hypothetical protein
MKRITSLLALGSLLTSALFLGSCSKNDSTNNSNSSQARLEVRLTDSPDPDVKEVWIDVREVNINMNDSNTIALSGSHPGLYNLLDLINGKDTILADALIPAGTISQIRLVLGDNNYIVTNSGEHIPLTTPSAQQSGLKLQLHQTVTGGTLYRLVLDFDAGKSIVKAGNSGQYILKPVIRLLSFVPSGGNITGVVWPDSIRTAIFAIIGVDTVASTYTDTTNGHYFIKDIAAGSYALHFNPSDTTYKTTERSATVVLGQTTAVDTVKLEKK